MSKTIDEQKTVDERIEFLRECANLYEAGKNSPLSDALYDKEYYELKEIAPNHSFFDEVGGQTVYGEKVPHTVTMGSLNKSRSPEEYRDWFKDHLKNTCLLLQPKIDGLSLKLVYKVNEDKKSATLIDAVSRGNGQVGQRVLYQARLIPSIPQTIPSDEDVEIRGEIFADKANFYSSDLCNQFKNTRNMASGTLMSKPDTIEKDKKMFKDRAIGFVAYECIQKEFSTEEAKISFLSSNGFENLEKYTKKIKGDTTSVYTALKEYMADLDSKKDEIPWDIDGVVAKVNDCEQVRKAGYTSDGKKSKIQRAIKYPCEIKEARLLSVEWSTGRTGRINPVALIEPTELCNTTVSRVTLNNVKEILDNGYTIGGMLKISKRGEIIPHIEGVVSSTDTSVEIPTKCNSCGSTLHPDATNTTLWCKNSENCDAQIVANICNYLAKMGVKDIASGIVTKLCDNNYVNCISDMYKLRDKDETTLKSLLGNKIYSNTLKNIDSALEVSLAKLIECLGVGKVGRTSKDITAVYPNIEDIDTLTVEKLCYIDGFSTIKSQGFIDGWKAIREEINEILKYVTIVEPVKVANKLGNKSFCVTGTLSRKRGDIQKDIELNGGIIRSSVSSKLDYLVCGENSGSKLDKAKRFGVTVISEEELTDMLK